MKIQPKWVWKDQLAIVALFVIANLVAYTAGDLVLPRVGWMWLAGGLFVLLLIARAAVLRACGRPLFGH